MIQIEQLIKLGKEHIDSFLDSTLDIQTRMEAYNNIYIVLGKIKQSYELEHFELDISVCDVIPTYISQECLKTSIETEGYDYDIIKYIYNVLAKYLLSQIITEQPEALKCYTKISRIKTEQDVIDVFKMRVDECMCDAYDDYETYKQLITQHEGIKNHITEYYQPIPIFNIYDEVDIENIVSLLGTNNIRDTNVMLISILEATSDYMLTKLIHNGLWEVIGDYEDE